MSTVSQEFRRSAVQTVRSLIKEAALHQVFLRKTLLKVAREEQAADEKDRPILSLEDRVACTNRLHAERVGHRPRIRRLLAILGLLRGVSSQRVEQTASSPIRQSEMMFILESALAHLPGYPQEKEVLHNACGAWLEGNEKAIFPALEAAQ